ncbi:MAG: hypothetical protein WAX04_05060 [Oscillospiraceae bacterium]
MNSSQQMASLSSCPNCAGSIRITEIAKGYELFDGVRHRKYLIKYFCTTCGFQSSTTEWRVE